MFWKLSNEFFSERVFLKCSATIHQGDRGQTLRAFALIKILTDSANGMFWRDAHECSKLTKQSEKVIDVVWKICETEGVLSQEQYGYSASKWLNEHGYTTDSRKKAGSTGSNISFL